MFNDLREQIYKNFELEETDTLLDIWQTNNRGEWSDLVFEILKEILADRLEAVPPQNEAVYDFVDVEEDDPVRSTWGIGGILTAYTWKRFPQRVRPADEFSLMNGCIMIFITYGWILSITIAIDIVSHGFVFSIGSLLGVFWFMGLYFVTYAVVSQFRQDKKDREMWKKGQLQTVAKILDRRFQERATEYGGSFTICELILAFTPTTLAGRNRKKRTMQVTVSESLFRKLMGCDTVNITYAVGDPRIFVLDGENVPGWKHP
ncbi:MAG TPA: hypothetical protein DCX54_10815 [Flavobacteriales bacterium]|nr:hypothetical protein [Flavobacteriales bacterium]